MSLLQAKPFRLFPAGKDYLWGGERLKSEFEKDISMSPLAETWECSTHPDGPSMVASGIHQGRSLRDVLQEFPSYLGTHPHHQGELPIMIKFIDAKQDLSVQVHPDDAYAKIHENGQLGKTEMWYVVDAAKDAQLIYGFHHDMDPQQIRDSLQEHTLEKYLQKVKIEKDDVFFIPSGTVHAIGAGALIAEIQESSNLTYRLYDYERTDKDGKPRELHLEKALTVMNKKKCGEPRQPLRVLKYRGGCATEFLCRCQYFQVERLLLNTERQRKLVDFHTEANSFKVLLCLEGCGTIFMDDGDLLNYFKGDCIFVPAETRNLKLHGKARFLVVSC